MCPFDETFLLTFDLQAVAHFVDGSVLHSSLGDGLVASVEHVGFFVGFLGVVLFSLFVGPCVNFVLRG